jgi:hypothetical protein
VAFAPHQRHRIPLVPPFNRVFDFTDLSQPAHRFLVWDPKLGLEALRGSVIDVVELNQTSLDLRQPLRELWVYLDSFAIQWPTRC